MEEYKVLIYRNIRKYTETQQLDFMHIKSCAKL